MLRRIKIDSFIQRLPIGGNPDGRAVLSGEERPPLTGASGPRIDRRKRSGYTLIEVCICIALICILAAIAVQSFLSYRYRAQIALTVSEIRMIATGISSYSAEKGEWPDSLADIQLSAMSDPWGNPYQYLRIDGGKTPGINGIRRRDKNANPVNSDYDLYSMGRDGQTAAQFTAAKARDDIVRATTGPITGLLKIISEFKQDAFRHQNIQ